MTITTLAEQIIAMYERHGWQFYGAILTDDYRDEFERAFPTALVESGPIDALWFSRASHGHRQAWELRLLAETPYALFETLAEDADEGSRDSVRAEMVKRMSERQGMNKSLDVIPKES